MVLLDELVGCGLAVQRAVIGSGPLGTGSVLCTQPCGVAEKNVGLYTALCTAPDCDWW